MNDLEFSNWVLRTVLFLAIAIPVGFIFYSIRYHEPKIWVDKSPIEIKRSE